MENSARHKSTRYEVWLVLSWLWVITKQGGRSHARKSSDSEDIVRDLLRSLTSGKYTLSSIIECFNLWFLPFLPRDGLLVVLSESPHNPRLCCFVFRIGLFFSFSLRRGRELPLNRDATDGTAGCHVRAYTAVTPCNSPITLCNNPIINTFIV